MEEAKIGRELTFDERISKVIVAVLALGIPMIVRRSLIVDILDLSYKHEEDIANAVKKGGEPF